VPCAVKRAGIADRIGAGSSQPDNPAGLTDAQRAHLEELLRNRPQWFKEKILADIAAEERRNDEDGTPRTGFSAYTLACLESELGIM